MSEASRRWSPDRRFYSSGDVHAFGTRFLHVHVDLPVSTCCVWDVIWTSVQNTARDVAWTDGRALITSAPKVKRAENCLQTRPRPLQLCVPLFQARGAARSVRSAKSPLISFSYIWFACVAVLFQDLRFYFARADYKLTYDSEHSDSDPAVGRFRAKHVLEAQGEAGGARVRAPRIHNPARPPG